MSICRGLCKSPWSYGLWDEIYISILVCGTVYIVPTLICTHLDERDGRGASSGYQVLPAPGYLTDLLQGLRLGSGHRAVVPFRIETLPEDVVGRPVRYD